MGKVKLLGVKTIRSIKKRLRDGESSYSISKDYDVTPGHIRKMKKGLTEPDHPNARWGYIE